MVEPFFDDTIRDGRRQSNPLLDPSSHTVKSPNMQLWRHVTADDAALVNGALPSVGRASGVNFRTYMGGTLHIVTRSAALITSPQGGTTNPAIKLLSWNEGLGLFTDTGVALAAIGAGLARAWSFDSFERILYFHTSGIAGGGSITLYTSGNFEEDR